MKKAVLILVMLCSAFPAFAGTDDALRRLDAELQKKALYDEAKEARIKQLQDRAMLATTDSESFRLYQQLFGEFASYNFDSAHSCASHLREIALRMKDKDCLLIADCDCVFCLMSAGFFKEAFDTVARIDTTGCSTRATARYYETMVRLNFAMADYNYEEDWRPGYIQEGCAWSEKLLSVLDRQSDDWHYHHADLAMKSGRTAESTAEFIYLLSRDIDLHRRAIVTSCLGWMYMQDGEEDKAVEYLAEAAICDLQSSTKETTALRMLADVLSRQGQTDRPTRYVRESFEDANFYDARQRKIEVGAVLPIIEQNRNEILQRERNTLLASIIVAILIILVAAGVIVFIRRQNRKLDEVNARLAEANDIKAEYIGSSFYANSEFIEKLAELYKTVDWMLATRQYEELRRSLKRSAISKERDQMCESFDTTFLKIFPDFIEEYNALFREADRVVPQHGLTTEMRIFALIRLGITESERIARFLDYSVHTINTYKTRVKNKSLVENDRFEDEIMKTGTR